MLPEVVLGASLLAAFLAGAVALFAPCCVTVLLPAYLGSVFQQKRNVLRMTFVFFLGVSVVLVPIGMGAAGLAELFRNFHSEMYVVGGAFMLVLAIFAVLGKSIPLIPMGKRQVPVTGANAGSIFGLGVFSGAATSCCAPVLAGAVTLAVVSGTFWNALAVSFAYVAGMVLPLFVTAYFYDRFKIERSRFIQGRMLTLPFGERGITVHSTNLFAGGVFFVMGALLFALGMSGDAFWSPEYQVRIGESLNTFSNNAFAALSILPDWAWGMLLAALFAYFVRVALQEKEEKNGELHENTEDNNNEHE